MLARKKWKVPEPDAAWPCREDGIIDVVRFDPESLYTPEECAAVTTELDKAIGHFGAKLKGFTEEYAATGIPTPKSLYYATQKLWTLAKTKRNSVQDRRGVLRRQNNTAIARAEDIRDERLFIQAAKEKLTQEQYLGLWEAVRLQKQGQPPRDRNNV